MKSVMTHQFSGAPTADIQRSTLKRDYGYKTTFDAGYLIPVYIDEVLPGDTFQLSAQLLGRLATPIHPIMDNLFIDIQFFAVPNRLIWDNWKRFQGERDNPDDNNDYLTPQVVSPAGGWLEHSLSDYFGLPTKKAGLSVCSFWHRAYNLIWNEWYRDENLQDQVVVDKDDGPDDSASYTLLKRGKRKDYFTGALPWPQKGDAIEIPLGDVAPVIGNGLSLGLTTNTTQYGIRVTSGYNAGIDTSASGLTLPATPGAGTAPPTNAAMGLSKNPDLSGVVADLSAATAATINSLREAFQLQKLLERDARGGTRYIEMILSHFHVRSPDFRMQRPEYLGGGTQRININPVVQTSSTDATTPQGNLAAYGLINGSFNGFFKSFTEHCVVMGLVSVRADITYSQGIPKMFLRRTRYDFYMPVLANLGEQEIYNKEIYAQATADDDLVFGYQERWAEYRYRPSQITGLFRPNATGTLNSWHLSETFGSLPLLNDTFITDKTDVTLDRCIAVPSQPQIIMDIFYQYNCTRPMPVYSIPGLIDHF